MQIPAITSARSPASRASPARASAASAASRPRLRLGLGRLRIACSPDAISSLNQSQNTAASDSVALATGQASDVTSVVSDVEKANLEMQLAVQVRNKAVDAYEEIMRMQI